MFIKLNKIIQQHISTKEEKELKEFKKLQKTWKQTETKQVLQNTIIKDFTNGVLTIQTTNTSWRNELSFIKEQVKKN